MASNERRLYRDVKDAIRSPDLQVSGISIEFNVEDFQSTRTFTAVVKGPPGSVYQSGTYFLDVSVPRTYPFDPPEIRFITPIWHPNISSVTGTVCLDTLGLNWIPVMTFRSALVSVQNLLINPEPLDPLDAVVGSQMNRSTQLYERVARFWCTNFAGGNYEDEEYSKHVQKVTDMGFSKTAAIRSLSTRDFDFQHAVADLLP